jgi:hypothetical protein
MRTTTPGWPIKIVRHGVLPAREFLANAHNIRIHPRAQSEATEGSLEELGWVKSVTVNLRTSDAWGPQDRYVETLLDGHDRIKIALHRGDEVPVPVEYVDLTPEQEDLFLLWVDEITAQAGKDKAKLATLLAAAKPSDPRMQAFLSELAAKEGIIPPAFQPVGIEQQGRLDEKAKVECPECGAVFEPKG